MCEFSIIDAISIGLTVQPVSTLGSFTETDPHLSFHQIPSYYEHIVLSLKWQSTNVISEDFLSNELCYFVESQSFSYFCLNSNNLEIPTGKFSYYLAEIVGDNFIVLSGPERLIQDNITEQFKSRGFILWESFDRQKNFENKPLKYGTFRNFYPNLRVKLIDNDHLLRCEYNTKKAVKYLKLLRKSYQDRLAKVFETVPNVLLDIISSYVFGEFLIEALYW
ncbi:MAG: hypothetical protein Harvfovirus19_21 [Harvfovirus sp.]|uniref:Uncharacterized protein n=1 Tax=Harvfovirus sp. TaxID=2487768 RepID=A0A3G5A1R6_9VIRU|nr:MAG: hypothetical protein Harvfovirus19_21 [Harvfovirus sp.]